MGDSRGPMSPDPDARQPPGLQSSLLVPLDFLIFLVFKFTPDLRFDNYPPTSVFFPCHPFTGFRGASETFGLDSFATPLTTFTGEVRGRA